MSHFLGVLVNAFAIIFGTIIGIIFKKAIPEKIKEPIMTVLGLCILVVGISGLSSGKNQLVLIVSMVFGTLIGELIDIDKHFNSFGNFVDKKISKSDGDNKISKGFVSASLLFCIGSMAITGSLEAGLSENNSILFTKSMIDMFSSIMLASTLGIGVALSAASVFVYQGAIVLLSSVLSPVLAESGGDIICCGSLMIIAIGLNMMNITKIKVANTLPSLIIVPFAVYFFSFIM